MLVFHPFANLLEIQKTFQKKLGEELLQFCIWISGFRILKPVNLCANKMLTQVRGAECVFVCTHAYRNMQRL